MRQAGARLLGGDLAMHQPVGASDRRGQHAGPEQLHRDLVSPGHQADIVWTRYTASRAGGASATILRDPTMIVSGRRTIIHVPRLQEPAAATPVHSTNAGE